MARIDERRKILEAKLKEMSEDGMMKGHFVPSASGKTC